MASAFPSRIDVFISNSRDRAWRIVVKLSAKSILRSRFGRGDFGFSGGSGFFSLSDWKVTFAQFFCVRQLVEVPKPEMFEEKLGGFVEQRAARHFGAPGNFQQTALH